jgi:YD repeat-containing protein
MKNALGTEENLELFNKEGQRVYRYCKDIEGLSYESTYDERGNKLTYKSSSGLSYESTYDERGNQLTYKSSSGLSWESTYDEQGNELTYKDSKGDTRGVNIPEFTMEELVAKLGNFKIKK